MKNIIEIESLSKDDLYKELLVADYMVSYYEEIKKEATKRAIQGDSFEGYFLKSRTTPRRVIDDTKLISRAKEFGIKVEDLYELIMLSPSKLTKKFKDQKEFLGSLDDILSETNEIYYLTKNKKEE